MLVYPLTVESLPNVLVRPLNKASLETVLVYSQTAEPQPVVIVSPLTGKPLTVVDGR